MCNIGKKKFSIIIPAYNAKNEIEKALTSIKNQTFTNYEIIVVDDCSTDGTYESLIVRDDIILIKNNTNSKAGASRNRGIEKATGEYIIFLDADDYLASNDTLEKINSIIGDDTPDIIYLGFKIIGRIQEEWIPTIENSTLSERARNWKYENVWDICWNTQFIKNNNLKFVENKFFEDFVFYYKGIINAKKYKVASFITHVYTMLKDTSITSCVNETKLQDLYYNVNEFLEELKKVDADKKADIVYAIYRVVEYSTRLLKEYENNLRQETSCNKVQLDNEQIEKKRYLTEKYKKLIEKYINVEYKEDNSNSADTIWICWWQGIENAPYIVKKCVRNIKKYAIDKKIIILNKNNYSKYITLPNYILKKLEDNTMSITHFSDVLRINILNEYGGVWLDATCLITSKDFLPNKLDFYTVKLPYNDNEPCISKGKWCVFFLKGSKKNVLFQYMKDFYDEYWKQEDKVIDYYLMDYMIQIAYENIPSIRNMIDKVPENNSRIHDLKNMLNEKFDKNEYLKLLKANSIHKLAHERIYNSYLDNGQMTFYGYLESDFDM